MSELLTSKQLQAMHKELNTGEAEPVVLSIHPQCHPNAAVDIWYYGAKMLTLRCCECQKDFARVPVAAKGFLE